MKFISLFIFCCAVSANANSQTVTVQSTDHKSSVLSFKNTYSDSQKINLPCFHYSKRNEQSYISVMAFNSYQMYNIDRSQTYYVFHYDKGYNTYLCDKEHFATLKNVVLDYVVNFDGKKPL